MVKETTTKHLKVLVIPDVHLKTWMFDRADKILASGQADYAVCLGDYFDDWGQEHDKAKYRAMADRIRQFSFEHNDTVWLLGNHDFAYLHPECGCSGHSVYMEEIVQDCLRLLKNTTSDLKVMVRLGRVLFSHAGLGQRFIEDKFPKAVEDCEKSLDFELTLPEKERTEFFKGTPGEKLIDTILPELNNCPFNSEYRKLWSDDSPLWIRPQLNTYIQMFNQGFVQVVGHTPTKQVQTWDNMITCDEFSTESEFPHKPWGEEKFIIVDCHEGTWEYARED